MVWIGVKSDIVGGQTPVKCPVGEMKQLPKNEYNDQTEEPKLTTDTMEEGCVVGSNEIEEMAKIF